MIFSFLFACPKPIKELFVLNMKKIHKSLAFLNGKYYYIHGKNKKVFSKQKIKVLKHEQFRNQRRNTTQNKARQKQNGQDSESRAQAFFQERFYQTSITDICRESNTAVGTFYIYFDDKTALYRCLMEDDTARNQGNNKRSSCSKRTAPHVLKRKRKVCGRLSNTARQITICLKSCGEA